MAKKNKFSLSVPEFITTVAQTLHNARFEAYLVGGCVRGLIMGREIADWDFCHRCDTGADSEDCLSIRCMKMTLVRSEWCWMVCLMASRIILVVEVTPYRKEKGYSDNRRPDEVVFCDSLDEDLARRDFTINALAYNPVTEELVDRYNGIADLHQGLIRSVGDPTERFEEDALRLMRAVRIATQLGGTVEKNTLRVIQEKSDTLASIAAERVREEFLKLVMADTPDTGLRLLLQTGLLAHIIPELLEGRWS